MVSRFSFPPAAAVLILVACGGPDDTAGNKASAAAAPNAKVARPSGTGAAPARPEGGALVRTLTGNGLDPGLPFGMPRVDAVAAATAAFGEPTGTEHNDECGEGPMDFVSFGGLQLGFQDGRLAGWSLSESHPSLRTAEGLAIGAPRSVLGEARIDEESTLGPEFDVNGVGGLLDENGRTVIALWAGLTCQFR